MHHSCCLERLKKHAFLCCNVYAIARRLAKPCIKIAPVSTSCAMATTSPFLSYFNPSRNVFVSGVSGATSEAFVSASSSAFFAAAVHLPTDDVVLDAVLPPHRPLCQRRSRPRCCWREEKNNAAFCLLLLRLCGWSVVAQRKHFWKKKTSLSSAPETTPSFLLLLLPKPPQCTFFAEEFYQRERDQM